MSEPALAATDRITISGMRWWHIEPVLDIEGDLFGAERWSAAMFWNELAAGHYYLVATGPGGGADGVGDIVGYAGLSRGSEEAWIQNIAVRRDTQGQGLGRRLLYALLERSTQWGVPATMLEVAVDNTPAQRLYDSAGFEIVGLRRGYYQPSNTDALVLRRDRDREA